MRPQTRQTARRDRLQTGAEANHAKIVIAIELLDQWRLARFEFSTNGDEPIATVGVPGGSVLVMASDAVDLEAEKRRAAERAGVLQKEIKRAEGKLANQAFIAKAPEAVVTAEREKLEKLKRELDELS